MAVTNPSDLFIPEVAAEYSSQAFVQSLELMQGLVGAPGSGAPIELMNDPVFGVEGQYLTRPVFKRIGSTLVARRDITSNSGLTPVNLTGGTEIAAKIHRRIGPVDVSVDAANLSRATPEQISAEIGKQAGEELMLNIQQSIIASLNGIVDGSTTTHTVTSWAAATRTNLSPSLLDGGLNIFGDYRERFRRSAKILTRSEAVRDLFADAQGRAFNGVGDKALAGVMDTNTLGMGVPLMVDSASLTVADAGFDKYITLLIGAGCLQVWFTKPMTFYPNFQVLDQEQVLNRTRADADFAIGAHGASYDTAAGGANPNDTALALSTNWDSNPYSNHRELKIAKLVHNYSGN